MGFVTRVVMRAAAVSTILVVASVSPAAEEPFTAVATIFERRCLVCHNDTDRKGGLSLVDRDAALAGGVQLAHRPRIGQRVDLEDQARGTPGLMVLALALDEGLELLTQ